MRDVRDNYAFAYSNAYEQDLELYIHQKVYKLVLENNETQANRLIRNLTNFVVPQHLGFEYAVDNTILYQANNDTRHFAKTSITSRILTYYFNESSSQTHFTTTNITIWS
jgi:hypothetical protein